MDAERFDRLAQLVGRTSSRRWFVRVATVAGLGGMVGELALEVGHGVAKNRHQTHRKAPGSKRPVVKTSAKQRAGQSCALQSYEGDNIDLGGAQDKFSKKRPDADRVDVDFFDSMDKIDQCAADNNVIVQVQSAYRNNETQKGTGSAAGSNSAHTAGHAIDMFVQYDLNNPKRVCNWNEHKHSGCLGSDPPYDPKKNRYTSDPLDGVEVAGDPAATQRVQSFIRCVERAGLRWGGRFKPRFDKHGDPVDNGFGQQQGFDPIHFDDGINQCGKHDEHCKTYFDDRKQAATDSSNFIHDEKGPFADRSSCPAGQRCNPATGKCERDTCDIDCGPCSHCEDANCVPDDDCCDPPCDTCSTCVEGSCAPMDCGSCSHCEDANCVSDENCCNPECDSCSSCENGSCVPVDCGPCSHCEDANCVPDDTCCSPECDSCSTCESGQCAPVDCGPCSHCEDANCVRDDNCCEPVCDSCSTCVEGSCQPVDCGPCSHCEDANCVPDENCCDPVCDSCSSCENGQCVADPTCCLQSCEECFTCQDGQCVRDPSCCLQSCDECFTCQDGECVRDRNCCLQSCDACSTCQNGECVRDPDCCDPPCSGGKSCQSGVCQCDAGLKDCGGTCTDTQSDDANCGGCADSGGTACSGGKACQSGQCDCEAGQTDCGGTCKDLKSDPANCNSCGRRCGARPQCWTCDNGVCSRPHSCLGSCCFGTLCTDVYADGVCVANGDGCGCCSPKLEDGSAHPKC